MSRTSALASSVLMALGLPTTQPRETQDGVPGRIAIPLRPGLTIITATHDDEHGDHESIKVVTAAAAEEIAVTFSSQNDAGGTRAFRRIRRADLDTARAYQAGFNADHEPVFAGTTAIGTSRRVLAELRTSGRAQFAFQPDDDGMRLGLLQRIDAAPTRYRLLLNDGLVDVPAIRARGVFDGDPAEFVFLDDPANPLTLRFRFGDRKLEVVRIAFPVERSAIGAALMASRRAEVHGIYFDTGSDRIRPESEPVLREIAAVLAQHPDWSLRVEGHTDSIGDSSENQTLSERRAAAVKRALVEQHRIASGRLAPAGFGESRPQDSNETLTGRARNRRVELVRQ